MTGVKRTKKATSQEPPAQSFESQVANYLIEWGVYPLHIRIGAILYERGYREKTANHLLHNEPFNKLHIALRVNIENTVRALERGQMQITPALRKLMNKINLEIE